MKKLKVVVIGCGLRGMAYTNIMARDPEKYEVVAVAEPLPDRRRYMQEKHNIPDNMCFEDWPELMALGKIADVAIISVMDREHHKLAMKAIELKYDLLLEKPVAPELPECVDIAKYAKEQGVKIMVCHVLRYAPVFVKIKEILDSGELGDIVSINHEECVGDIHQSHSFVRGNWGNSKRSSTMLLQKSCHDIDLLSWLISKECKQVQSFGNIAYFKKENAPEGSPEFCIDGCPQAETCPYNAVKLYLDKKENDWFRPVSTGMIDPQDVDVEKALRTTNYGRCVFKCDNDVVDHQTVNMLFEDDVTVTFTMAAFNKGGRHIHVMCTKGELRASTDDSIIHTYNFVTKEDKDFDVNALSDSIINGHGGGDDGIVEALYSYFALDKKLDNVTEIDVSLKSHILVFAAEESRLSGGKTVDLEEFKSRYL